MTSRERIRIALRHKETDRIPIDLNGTNQSGITSGAYQGLIGHLVIEGDIRIIEQMQQLADVDKTILTMFGVDTVKFTANPPSFWSFERYEDDENYYFDDEWGMTWKMPKDSPRYFDFSTFPLAGRSLDEIRKYEWPDPDDKARFTGLREKAEEIYHSTDKAMVAAHPNGPGILEQAYWMSGMEDFFVDMLTDKRKADYVLHTITELYISIWDNYLDEIGEYIEVCVLSEDLGTQTGPIISLALYKESLELLLKKLIESIRKKTDAKIYLHSCGNVSSFIPSFIEIGVDILNPIQVSAGAMGDTAWLKREYGNDVVFWGAACDPQKTLPFGSTKEVADEVRRHIRDLAPDGGFVFAPIHNIQTGVPPENIVAMYQTALEYGVY